MVEGAGTTSYTYDDAGRLTQLTNWNSESTSWIYDNASRTTRQTIASGANTDYGYDSRNRQTSVSHKKSDGTVLSSESYVYDNAGNMSSKTVGSTTTTYGYDNIDQLLSETRTGYDCDYTYDANGNRLSKVLNNVTESYTYDDADKMLTAGSKSYTYDAAGRTTAVTSGGQTTNLYYDYESRLTQIVYSNNATNTFTYNGLDTRVGKSDSGGTKTYKRDGVGVTAPVLSDGVSAFTPGIPTRTSGATKFNHGDRLGTLGIETNASQAVSATKQYDAFGNLELSSGSSASPFGFAGGFGYQEDPDSGLKLLGHRYYDSSTGRFLTRDPIKDGRNWYGYCVNNPLQYVDPSGLAPALDSVNANPEIAAELVAEGIIDGGAGAAAESGVTYLNCGFGSRLGWAFAEWFSKLPKPLQVLATMAFGLIESLGDEATGGAGRLPVVFYPNGLTKAGGGIPGVMQGTPLHPNPGVPMIAIVERTSKSSGKRAFKYAQGFIFDQVELLGIIDFEGRRGHPNPHWHPWDGGQRGDPQRFFGSWKPREQF